MPNAIDFNTPIKTTFDISLDDGEADEQENSQCPRLLSPPLFLALCPEPTNCKITSFCLSWTHYSKKSLAHFWSSQYVDNVYLTTLVPYFDNACRSLNSVAITPNLLTWLPSERKQNVMFSRVKWPTLAPRVSLCPHIKALHSYISLQSFEHKSLYPLIFWTIISHIYASMLNQCCKTVS